MTVNTTKLPTPSDAHVADIHFRDGSLRPVYECADGRQYVIADDGDRVYGVWFIPREVGPDVIVGE
jgi:hypothetical protein